MEDYARLEAAARERGLTPSEWCREVLLARGKETKPTAPAGTEVQALMAELVALRSILLNVLYKMATGQELTSEDMQRLIDRADSDKLKKEQQNLARAGTDAAAKNS